MEICKAQMNCDIEIEFAAELSTGTFNALQVRPISSDVMQADVDWKSIDCSGAMVYSGSALGTGWINGLFDVVYVKADAFDKMKTEEMAALLTGIGTDYLQGFLFSKPVPIEEFARTFLAA